MDPRLVIKIRQKEILAKIEANSPFEVTNTTRIIKKYFLKPPRFVRCVIGSLGLHQKSVLEIGCSYGQSLLYWGEGSEAIEVEKTYHDWLKGMGVTFHEANVEDGFGAIQKKFDVVVTNNLFEHIVAPHLYLARIFNALNDDGVLVIGHPLVPSVWVRWFWKAIGYQGWLAGEHVNFFTPHTARLTIERAGFEVKHQYFPPLKTGVHFIDQLILPFAVQCVSECRKVPGYKYHSSRKPVFDPVWARTDVSQFHDQ